MIFKDRKANQLASSLILAAIACCTVSINAVAAETKNKSFKSRQKALPITIEQDRSFDLHLVFAQSFPETNDGISFDEKNYFYFSDIEQTIPIRNQPQIAKAFSGQASWYGPGFHGRLTANGERYNQNAFTAAHRYLRFGTKVRVTNLRNGRSVVVRINDRGPYAKGRVIDLSAAAARTVDMIRMGVAPVSVEVLGR